MQDENKAIIPLPLYLIFPPTSPSRNYTRCEKKGLRRIPAEEQKVVNNCINYHLRLFCTRINNGRKKEKKRETNLKAEEKWKKNGLGTWKKPMASGLLIK